MTDAGDAIEALRWRDEILGVLFWLRGEEIMHAASVSELGGFLVAEAGVLEYHLERLTAEGLLLRDDDIDETDNTRYALSPNGIREGGRVFADDFAELTGSAHGECGPGCSCNRHGAGACQVPIG